METIEESIRHWRLWDYVNLGPQLVIPARKKATLQPTASPLFWKTSFSHDTGFVLYNAATLPYLRSAVENVKSRNLDTHLGQNCKEQWVPLYVMAAQEPGISDITGNFEDRTAKHQLSMAYLAAALE